MELKIFRAKRKEVNQLAEVLKACDLSTTDLEDHIHCFYTARFGDEIVGCIGLEMYGKYGIIRSTAVLPRHRKHRTGTQLAQRMIDFARLQGIDVLYLKTDNEANFFSNQGFIAISPDQLLGEIKGSAMLAESCCGPAATVMMLPLRAAAVEESTLSQAVKNKYATLAGAFASSSESSSCCGSGTAQKSAVTRDLYDHFSGDIPAEALAASLGCGNPTMLAQIKPGEVILDLGSGGGLDVFLSAKKTGPFGKVYGLDMTDEMLELARENQKKAGLENVEFLKGHIEDIPLPANTIDLIISNCVVNLSPDKDQVIVEAFRVLKPGGRFAISDIVFLKKMPDKLKKNMEAWSGCIAGALERDEYISILENAGFEDIKIQVTRTYELEDFRKYPGFRDLSHEEMKELEGAMTASFVKARKPQIKNKHKKAKTANQERVALISAYETGFQPLIVSTTGASLLEKDITPKAYDLYLDKSDKTGIENHDFYGIGLSLFDSLQGGVAIAEEIREKNPSAHICFYGPYASLNKDRLLKYGDTCILGEWEQPIAQLAQAVLEGKAWHFTDHVYSLKNKSAAVHIDRGKGVVPARHLLPSIHTYTNTFIENVLNKKMVVGNIETSRGCHHKCKFCSVFAISGNRVKFMDPEVIMADVDQLVQSGVEHITFVDAEFINRIKFSTAIVNQIHEKYPWLTYDFTARIDHIVENEAAIPEFKRTGCIAVTTSIEFPSEEILTQLQKEITLDHIVKGMEILKRSGIQVHTTFVTFNPWSNLEGLMTLASFIKENNLGDVIDPIQFETRLHLYKGSPLLEEEFISNLKLHEREFHYEWEHPDPRVEEVFERMARPAQEGEFKRCCLRC